MKAIYIPIVSLFWETIKKKKKPLMTRERDDLPGVKLIIIKKKSSVAIIRAQIDLNR